MLISYPKISVRSQGQCSAWQAINSDPMLACRPRVKSDIPEPLKVSQLREVRNQRRHCLSKPRLFLEGTLNHPFEHSSPASPGLHGGGTFVLTDPPTGLLSLPN
jgi:hypothetical protein